MEDIIHLSFPEKKTVNATWMIIGLQEFRFDVTLLVDNMTYGKFPAMGYRLFIS
jgi:hypothetical protein